MTALDIRGLQVGYGAVPVLHSLDLHVPSGTLAAVLGPSGCGKTTLLRTVAGLVRAGAGSIRLGERTVQDDAVFVPPERRRVGLVPQDAALFPHLDVAANVAFGLRRRAGRSARVEELLGLVGLGDLARRMPHELSGGQRHRVAVARALAPRPDVVLLDEPFSALDAALRADLRGEVREVLRREGTTAVLVTHDQDEALSVADVVGVLHEGRLQQVGAPDDVYARPASAWVGLFVGEAVLLPGRSTRGLVGCALGDLRPVWPSVAGAADPDVADGDPVEVLVRAEQICVVAPDAAPVRGVVRRSAYFGHDAVHVVDLDGGTATGVLVRTAAGTTTEAGQWVGLRVEGPVCAYAVAAAVRTPPVARPTPPVGGPVPDAVVAG